MKTRIIIVGLIIAFLAGGSVGCSDKQTQKNGNNSDIDTPDHGGGTTSVHPILFIKSGDLGRLAVNIQADTYLRTIHTNLIAACESMLSLPVKGRVTDTPGDKRILKAAREIMRRIYFLSYAYHTTAEKKYMDRAMEEMRSVAKFTDWNAPNHFLDVAELTMAMSVGYDWLYSDMNDSDRSLIRTAIIDKGLKPSDNPKYNSNFLNKNNNWNQVCNTAMAAGAIVTMDYDKAEANRYIDRSVEKIRIPMALYAPDGGYAEGVDYWEYGTMYNAMLIDMLEAAFGSDRALGSIAGFKKTGAYSQQMITSTLNAYCYSDNNSSSVLSSPVMWFYKKTNDPALLYMQRRIMDLGSKVYTNNNRYLPMLLIWAAQANAKLAQAALPTSNFYLANGTTPVCVMRSGWDADDLYLGVKGGISSSSHSHMDQGSFIFEAKGQRWAIDLGAEKYANIEANTSDFWQMGQTSGRWALMRYGNLSHNTLTFGPSSMPFQPARQNVNGKVEFTAHSSNVANMSATLDLTPAYTGVAGVNLRSVTRTASLLGAGYAMIQDKVSTASTTTTMQWRMTVLATSMQISGNTMTITNNNGKKLILKVESTQPITMKTWSSAPDASYESQNPGTMIVGFETQLPANQDFEFRSYLMPDAVIAIP